MIKKWYIQIPELSGDALRRAYIYLPDDWRTSGKRYPVLYMFDGHNVFFDSDATYGKSWGMGEYMDSSAKQLIVVAVECNHFAHRRLVEYSPINIYFPDVGELEGQGKTYMDWLVGTLKPYIDSKYPTLPDRAHTAIGGSSMGGLMALYAVCEYNHVFQKAACLSPSFWVDKEKVLELVENSGVAPDTCIYIDYGSVELANHAPNSEALISVTRHLLTSGANVALRIIPGGTHSEQSWQRQIPKFMEYLGL